MTATLQKTSALCWRFEAADVSHLDLIADLVKSICHEYHVDASRRSDLELVIAEAVNNAIDHGVLGLDSAMKKSPDGFGQYFITRAEKLGELKDGYVQVSVDQLDATTINICVEDSGAGFDVPAVLQNIQPDSLLNSYGRGLVIIRQLCESMTHAGNGNCIFLEFRTSCR